MATDAVVVPAAMDGTGDDPAAGSRRCSTHISSGCSGWPAAWPASEDARDLVQETFLRAARAPQRGADGASHEEAWLVRVLINVCRDRWRQAAVRHAAPRPRGTSRRPAPSIPNRR